MFCIEIECLSFVGLLVFLGKKKWSRKKHKLCKKGGNYQHLNKMDILDNAVGNVKKVMVWISHHINEQ